jgi:hypothetical protein
VLSHNVAKILVSGIYPAAEKFRNFKEHSLEIILLLFNLIEKIFAGPS